MGQRGVLFARAPPGEHRSCRVDPLSETMCSARGSRREPQGLGWERHRNRGHHPRNTLRVPLGIPTGWSREYLQIRRLSSARSRRSRLSFRQSRFAHALQHVLGIGRRLMARSAPERCNMVSIAAPPQPVHEPLRAVPTEHSKRRAERNARGFFRPVIGGSLRSLPHSDEPHGVRWQDRTTDAWPMTR